MKLFRSISVSQPRCPPEIYETIVRLKPECRKSDFFHLEAKPDDGDGAELVERIRSLCDQHGLKRTLDKTVGSYNYLLMPVYDKEDFSSAPLLTIVTQRKMFQTASDRDEQGRLTLPATQAKSNVKIGSIYPRPWIVVSDAVRQALEAGQLVGLEFPEVQLKGVSIHAATTPFWELKSTITLPRLANAFPIEGRPFPCYLLNDELAELHYRRRDLQSLEPFDIAHTFEPLGGPDQHLVISQRFYQHCLKHKIPLEVRPVRIDPD